MLMRPIWPAWYSLNQSSPSRTTNESGRQPGVRPFVNSVTAPPGVMRPMRLTWASENHTFPSGPATMPSGPAPTVGTGNSVTAPDVVIRPILLPAFSQNHNAPSAAGVIPTGRLFGVGVSNSTKRPLRGSILPILDVPFSQNQRCRSGPNTMMYGLLCGVGIGCRTISTSAIDHCPCTAEGESDAVCLACRGSVGARVPSREEMSLTHALVAARSNGNAEQPCGVGAENRVLLLLSDFLGAADIFDRPLFCKRIVGGEHDMARGDLGHQELQHVRIEQHGVVEEARQVAAEVTLEMRGAAVAIIVIVTPGIERQISAAVGDHDFQLGKLIHDALVDQRRQGVGLLQWLPDRDHQPIAEHAFVGIAGGVDEDHGTELFCLAPERPQALVPQLDPVYVRGNDNAA